MTKGERYNDMINQLAQDMSHTNQMAMAALGDRLPDIYAVNANYAAYEVSKEAGMNLSFTMYDHNTVEKLVKEDSDLLPKPRVSIPEDERWNRGKIRSALTQGILQGDSIPNISKRLQQVTDMNRRAAVRNARTMCTSAQNAGRLARYNEAEDKYGLMFDKVWIATHDSRTRDSHKAIDGEEVSKDEPFSNGLMYPADPDGEPEEVYNCRCTMKSVYTGKKGHETDDVEKFDQKKSFEEYEKEQESQKEEHKTKEEPKKQEESTDIKKMSRKQLEEEAVKEYIKKNASLGAKEAERRARALMSGNTDAQLRKYITNQRKKKK